MFLAATRTRRSSGELASSGINRTNLVNTVKRILILICQTADDLKASHTDVSCKHRFFIFWLLLVSILIFLAFSGRSEDLAAIKSDQQELQLRNRNGNRLNLENWADLDAPKATYSEGRAVLNGRFCNAAVALTDERSTDQMSIRRAPLDQGEYPIYLQTVETIVSGEIAQSKLGLRFGSGWERSSGSVTDFYQSSRQRNRQPLTWPDRRPIGSLFLARVNTKWPTNPRGWFSDQAIDVTTESGRSLFKQRLMQYAMESIALLKEMDAQGMILWDVEGQEFPQGEATYAGDPTQLPRLAPEMNAVADEFLRRFTNQRLRVGLCIRCNEIVFQSDGSFYQREYADDDAALDGLDKKISYARGRWRCTLFYIDSNAGKHGVLDVGVFRRLQQKHPDCLIAPEQCTTEYFACTAPYRELRKSAPWGGVACTPKTTKELYPETFSLINVADGDIHGRRNELLQAVKHGDILLYRSWYRSDEFPEVKSIYRDAGTGPLSIRVRNH
jgi:hypothetical protein